MGYLESWAAWQGADGQVASGLALGDVFAQIQARAVGHYQHKGSDFRGEVVRKRKVFGITSGERPPVLSDADDVAYLEHAQRFIRPRPPQLEGDGALAD